VSIIIFKSNTKYLIFKTQGCIIKILHKKEGDNVEVGEKIRAARIAKGMTQEALGDLLGVQKSAIAKYESGRVVNIKRSTLKKISDILDIRPSELIFDVGPNPIATAERHFEMIMDEDLAEIFEDFQKLSPKNRQIVKNLVHSLAESEA
jgi:transcriptional regulator with XRE-family HTH domain